MSELRKPQRPKTAESQEHARRSRLLYDVIELTWELTKTLMRSAERHARQDYLGTRLALARAHQLVAQMRDKMDSVTGELLGRGPEGSSDIPPRLDA